MGISYAERCTLKNVNVNGLFIANFLLNVIAKEF